MFIQHIPITKQRKVILATLCLWLCIGLAAAWHFGHWLAGAALPLFPIDFLRDSSGGILDYLLDPIQVLVLCGLGILAWRKCKPVLTALFCFLVLALLLAGWLQLYRVEEQLNKAFSGISFAPFTK
jgi:hypothetical protein